MCYLRSCTKNTILQDRRDFNRTPAAGYMILARGCTNCGPLDLQSRIGIIAIMPWGQYHPNTLLHNLVLFCLCNTLHGRGVYDKIDAPIATKFNKRLLKTDESVFNLVGNKNRQEWCTCRCGCCKVENVGVFR